LSKEAVLGCTVTPVIVAMIFPQKVADDRLLIANMDRTLNLF